MAVAGIFREGGAVAGAEHRLAAILDQRHFTFEDVDELVLVRVPVALARPVARRQVREIDAHIGEPAGVAETLPQALGRGCGEWIGIGRALSRGHRGEVDLRHGGQPITAGGSSHLDARPNRSLRPNWLCGRGYESTLPAT